MEDKINNVELCIEEIHSSVVILQKAVQCENGKLSLSDIDNYLEVILEKINSTLNDINEIVQQNI